jgi:hypothetical protein
VPERINGGQALAGLGGAILFISLFLDWFGPAGGGQGADAWTVFELSDLILAALALFVLAIALNPLLQLGLRLPVGSVPWAGAGALIIVAGSLIQKPPAVIHGSVEAGAWLGLAATLLMLAGGILSTARISLVISRSPARTPPPQSRPAAGPATAPPTEPEPGASETATRPIRNEDL